MEHRRPVCTASGYLQPATSAYPQPASLIVRTRDPHLIPASLLPVFLFGLSLVLAVGPVSSIRAQQNVQRGDIRGYVTDHESGEALPFANVILVGTTQGTMSTANGYFVLVRVPAGICSLQVSYIGYETQFVKVNNKPGEMEALNIRMQPRPLEMEGVVVTAYREEMVQTTEQVSQVIVAPEQLATLPSIGEIDIFRSLQFLPGISGVTDGSSGLYVRGGTPDQNLVLFDGMTIYHVDHFFGFFSAFNADAVKNVQVWKGGYPARYGGRLSSVVNLIGKTGDRYRPRLSAGANLLSVNGAVEYPINEHLTFMAAGRRSFTDFLQSGLYEKIYDTLTGDQGGAPGQGVRGGMRPGAGGAGRMFTGTYRPDFYFSDLNARLSLIDVGRNTVNLSFYAGADNLDRSRNYGDMGFTFPGSQEQTNLETSDIQRWGNVGASAVWTRQWHERFRTDLLFAGSVYFSSYDRGTNMGGSFGAQEDSIGIARGLASASEEENRVEDRTVRLDAAWNLARSHELGFGVELSRFNARFQTTLNDTLRLIDRSDTSELYSAYLQDTWRIGPLEATAGVRTARFEQTAANYLDPRLSLTWSLSDRLSLKGAWGHYRQFVNRIVNENVLEGSRDFWILADEELQPGFAEHLIAGVSWESGTWLLSAEAYRKEMDNLVEYTRRVQRPDQPDRYFFLGTGTARGLELLVQKKRGLLTGWVGYTLGEVEHTFPELNDGRPFPADHDRRHEINTVVRRTVGDWTFAATWTYATGRAYTAPESQYFIELLDGEYLSYIHISGKNANRLPDYHRLDMSASRQWIGESVITELGVSLFNAYNRRNVWYREYQLDTTPITVTDALMLGLTPTVFVKFRLK